MLIFCKNKIYVTSRYNIAADMVYKNAKFARILRGHGLEATQIEY